MDFDPFEVLNVSSSASVDEITQARRRLARVFHPDVSERGTDTEEMMKRINRAYDALTDPEKRRQFLEKKSDAEEFKHSRPPPSSVYNIQALSGYEFRSKHFYQHFCHSHSEKAKIHMRNNSEFYKKYFEPEIEAAYIDYMTKQEHRRMRHHISLNEVYNSVEKYFYFKDNFEDVIAGLSSTIIRNQTIRKILTSNKTAFSSVSSKFSVGEKTPIVHLRTFELSKLEELLFALEPNKALKKTNSVESIITMLAPILPNIVIEPKKPFSKSNICFKCKSKKGFFASYYNCVACGERFCFKCVLERDSDRLPRLGFIRERICQGCNHENEIWEANCWLRTAEVHMRDGQLNKALFCFRAALDLNKISRENAEGGVEDFEIKCLENFRNPEIRAVFIFDTLMFHENLDAYLKSFYLNELANCIQAMADVHAQDEHKYFLYQQSLIVHLINESESSSRFHSVTNASIGTLKQNIASLVKKTVENARNSTLSSSFVTQLHEFIQYNKNEEIFSLLFKNRTSLNARYAYQLYLDENESNKEDGEERVNISFLFAKGVFYIFYGLSENQRVRGFNWLELAFWKSLNYPFGSAELYVRVLTSAFRLGIPLPFEQLFRFSGTKKRESMQEYFFEYLLPRRESLKPSESKLWSNISLQNKNLAPFKIYEKAIYYNSKHKLMNWTRLKTALAYIDLTDACENYHELVFCFVQAAAWCLDAMDDDTETKSVQDKYAFSRLLFKCVEYATFLSYMYLDTVSKACVFPHLFGLAYYADRFEVEKDSQLIAKLFKFYLFGSNLLPMANFPLILVGEAAILSCNLRELSESFFSSMMSIPSMFSPLESFVYSYVRFEMNQHSRKSREEDPQTSAELKLTSMYSFLEKHGLEWKNVVQYIDYPLVERTKDGWIATEKMKKLNIERKDGKFRKFNGFKINKNTHEITLLVEPSTNAFMALFCHKEDSPKFDWSDIATVMCNMADASPCYFSLDQIDERLELHPFQKFDYKPSYLKGSNFLHTLFHTDYLLKQFSMGVEVNCLPPFEIRDLDDKQDKDDG